MRTYTPLPDDDYNGEPGCLVILIATFASFVVVAGLIGFVHLVIVILQ